MKERNIGVAVYGGNELGSRFCEAPTRVSNEMLESVSQYKREKFMSQNYNYPYATRETYFFLKKAISEGAHLKTPKHLVRYDDADKRWARIRNMAGMYFSSYATYDDIGVMHGISKQAVKSNVRTFIDSVWANSSSDTKIAFPKHIIRLGKPQTIKTRERKSDSRGGHLGEVLTLLSNNNSVDEIASETGLSTTEVKHVLRPHKRFARSQLKERLVQCQGFDYEDKQELLARVTRGFYQHNRNLFATRTEICRLFRIKPHQTSTDRIRKALANYKIAVGEINISDDRSVSFILRADFIRLRKMINSNKRR